MRFVSPELLYVLLLLPAVVALGLYLTGRRARALARFAGEAQHHRWFRREVSPHRRAAKAILLVLAAGCVVVAAARPQWGGRLEAVSRRGVDVVVVLDVSRSMAAEDIAPNRFEAARYAAATLMRRLEGDRVGLVTFAGVATLSCPLTLDDGAARLFLDAVDMDYAARPGTSLSEAIDTAIAALEPAEEADPDRGRIIVLYSDGEDHEGEIERTIDRLRRARVQLFAVGVGTVEGGPIPLTDATGAVTGYKKDRDGKVVTTRLAEPVLEELAVKSGGRYYRASPAGLEIDSIVDGIAESDAGEVGTVLRTRYEERFQIPLVLAVLALIAEALVPDRRREPLAVGGRR